MPSTCFGSVVDSRFVLGLTQTSTKGCPFAIKAALHKIIFFVYFLYLHFSFFFFIFDFFFMIFFFFLLHFQKKNSKKNFFFFFFFGKKNCGKNKNFIPFFQSFPKRLKTVAVISTIVFSNIA